MADYSIGLSGLTAAQRAFEVIGNNIANASTEGYHRQEIQLSPAFAQTPGSTTFIGGVNVDGIKRMIDKLLEQEILHQKSTLASTSQQAATLGTIEAAFGEFTDDNGGLNAAIDNFFNSLQNLSSHPDQNIWQNQVANDAQIMSTQFQSLATFLESLQGQIKLEAETNTDTINRLSSQIADLNQQIERISLVGGQTNSMEDQRDEYITELSDLIGIQTTSRKNGVVDVNAGGIFLVTGAFSAKMESGYNDDGLLGICVAGTSNYTTNFEGGKMGALLTLHNNTVSGYVDSLNSLAGAIIQQINSIHVMGVGSAGSFTALTGKSAISDQLSTIGNITDGTVYIRLTNTATGEVTRHAITIDSANGTLGDVATAISSITGLNASVNSSNQLTILADTGYTFDFTTALLPEPTDIDFDDVAPPTVTVSGIYNGNQSDTLQFKAIGDGSVGNGTLSLEVRENNGSGDLIKTFNIGSGYAVGDLLDVGNGIKISLSTGNLAESNGDQFSVDALASSDTAGFLSAVRINTFFSGSSALDISMNTDIAQNPHRIATATGADGTDNSNIMQMVALKDKAIDDLGSLTCGQFYQRFVSRIGQDVSSSQMHQDNLQAVLLNLTNRQSQTSGVDINDEAAQMMLFEQMFQGMAKYMNTINNSVKSLMELV